MDEDAFAKRIKVSIERIEEILLKKNAEYAPVADKLHNFRTTAALKGENMAQALGGFMAKHTTSIYDMIGSGKYYPMSQWEEKIYDHIIYLLLLRCVLDDEDARAEALSIKCCDMCDARDRHNERMRSDVQDESDESVQMDGK